VEYGFDAAGFLSEREEHAMSRRLPKLRAAPKTAGAGTRRDVAPATPADGAGTTRRPARNEDQLPPPGSDDPWIDLHPARIWPD
jgi:hypothetical protein